VRFRLSHPPINSRPLEEATQWLNQFRTFRHHKLNALETEIASGKRERRSGKFAEKKPFAARNRGDSFPLQG
jgi:hypothetical protein